MMMTPAVLVAEDIMKFGLNKGIPMLAQEIKKMPDFIPCDPPIEFIDEVCGIMFRGVFLENPNMMVFQHTHEYDHASYIGSGSVRLWVNDEWMGDFKAGTAVPVIAGSRHAFMSLEPGTRICCIHADPDGIAEQRGL